MESSNIDSPELKQDPIWVVGPPRSGTTLTSKILGEHPAIGAVSETHFFEDIWTRFSAEDLSSDTLFEAIQTLYARYNFPDYQEKLDATLGTAQLKEIIENSKSLEELYVQLFIHLVEPDGKRRFCDDTPKHLYHLDTLTQLFPESNFIAAIRDPRDFLSSYKNYWKRSTESSRVKALYHPIITSLNWRASARLILKHKKKYGDKLYISRYEALVTEPETAVSQLCDFVGESFSKQMIEIQSDNSSYGAQGSGIFSSSVGRWREALSPNEIWWMQTLASKEMEAFGYEREEISPSPFRIVTDAISAPFSLLRALRANRNKRGALLPYILKRISAVGT